MSGQITGPVAIVGAGHSGGRTALALREQGYRGPLVLIGEESYVPYERPPLSKQLLLGAAEAPDCYLDKRADYTGLDIDLHLECSAVRLDRDKRTLKLSDGSIVDYQALILATGGQVRQLTIPGNDLEGVHYLRTLKDATALRASLLDARHCVVIGGGFIGLEVASSARQMGCEVSVLEATDRLAARVLPTPISHYLHDLHRHNGVDIRLECRIQRLEGTDKVEAVVLESGEILSCDRVVVGIGIIPNTALAETSGLDTGNGIRVNAHLQTNDPAIYAIGDVCEHRSPMTASWCRQETWRNAEDQARHVAHHLLGDPTPFQSLPAFWSDQYDASLQLIGNPSAAAHTIVRPHDDDHILLFHLDASARLVGVSGFGPGNRISKDIKISAQLINNGGPLDPAGLADPTVKLKPMLKA
ncbi:NAD(P)/FAD-dependent oxidoreductase [Aidingimonas halophila]|uniref:3-phenylpropionate/trans-cinnamate dioxygenase ferredoxin reductase subunit n=1 Tax=Aidingimonas halophila TaxID=574349 RepID=A0A1H2ZCL1_9GAMM|nr:FAD-dependent oxidoreductase [Aidingimonas halophila]GHC15763.1 ferredoxin reductase [Aidingimonas halophila]SDX15075.1 3-phenylpropionate/trans-cinnamate dioxygenase ferredoxin reductase subunit [Aidingimonas halophila]